MTARARAAAWTTPRCSRGRRFARARQPGLGDRATSCPRGARSPAPAATLVRIFAPEHGLWGVAQDMEAVGRGARAGARRRRWSRSTAPRPRRWRRAPSDLDGPRRAGRGPARHRVPLLHVRRDAGARDGGLRGGRRRGDRLRPAQPARRRRARGRAGGAGVPLVRLGAAGAGAPRDDARRAGAAAARRAPPRPRALGARRARGGAARRGGTRPACRGWRRRPTCRRRSRRRSTRARASSRRPTSPRGAARRGRSSSSARRGSTARRWRRGSTRSTCPVSRFRADRVPAGVRQARREGVRAGSSGTSTDRAALRPARDRRAPARRGARAAPAASSPGGARRTSSSPDVPGDRPAHRLGRGARGDRGAGPTRNACSPLWAGALRGVRGAQEGVPALPDAVSRRRCGSPVQGRG